MASIRCPTAIYPPTRHLARSRMNTSNWLVRVSKDNTGQSRDDAGTRRPFAPARLVPAALHLTERHTRR